MPTHRLAGTACRQLLPLLPTNLVVFDGHCLMSQARARFVVARNFSFWSYSSYALKAGEEDEELRQREELMRHRLFFVSLNSGEGRDLMRTLFATPTTPTPSSSRPSASSSSTAPRKPPPPEDLLLLLVEVQPTRQASLLARRGATSASTSQHSRDAVLFAAASSTSRKPAAATSFAMTRQAEDVELIISTNYAAMCRVCYHLDRWWLRVLARPLYHLVPDRCGEWLVHRFIHPRRRTIWGSSEEDGVLVDDRIEGMSERRWSWRQRGIGGARGGTPSSR